MNSSSPRHPHLYSIKTKLIASFLVLGLVPLALLSFLSSFGYEQNLSRNAIGYTEEVIEQVDRAMSGYLADVFRILHLRNNYYVSQYVKLADLDERLTATRFAYRIWEDFNFLLNTKSDLEDLVIITHTGRAVSSIGEFFVDLERDPGYQALHTTTTAQAHIRPPFRSPTGAYLFSVSQPIVDSSDQNIGVMRVDISVRLLDEIISATNLGSSGFLFLTDGQQRIVYHTDHRMIGQPLTSVLPAHAYVQNGSDTYRFDGQEFLVTTRRSSTTGWTYVSVSNKREIIAGLRWFRTLSTVVVVAACAAIVIILSFYLSNVLTKPIRRLRESMERVSHNAFPLSIGINTRDEIGVLARTFEQMIGRIRELMAEVVADQQRIRQLEMQALHEQIKPHFIYNTLDSILSLLETGDSENAMEMIEHFGKFLRTSLSDGEQIITIDQELHHIDSYLFIQRFRYGNRFDYRINASAEIRQHQTLKLLLQPLVENALAHGFRDLQRQGFIEISAAGSNGHLQFAVSDNGHGIDDVCMQQIQTALKVEPSSAAEKESTPGSACFGIRSTQNRIQLNYGRSFGLRLETVEGSGTRALVTLPLQ